MPTPEIKNPTSLPPVFVMNTYYTGIGIARNLRRYGVEVYGLSSEADAPGIQSRFFKAIYQIPNSRDESEALCEKLIQLRALHVGTPVIFPTRDFDIMFLEDHRRELSSLYRLPKYSGVECLLDKLALFRVATELGIPVPATVVCSSVEEIAATLPSLRFPLVVKPRIAAQWRKKGMWSGIGGRKAFLVTRPEELKAEYLQISSVSREVMVQEYVDGSDCDIAVCCCFMDEKQEMTAYFTARKLRQNPPLFGTGCAVETIDIPELVPITKRLLQGIGYTGIAEVEFKRDCSNGKWFLIEVNPRHWDQHEIGAHIGVNLSWIAYQDMIGLTVQPQVTARKSGAQFRWIAETEALMLVLRNAYREIQESRRLPLSLTQRLRRHCVAVKNLFVELGFLLKGKKVFAIFHLRDPLPGILLCLRTLREVFDVLARPLRISSQKGMTS